MKLLKRSPFASHNPLNMTQQSQNREIVACKKLYFVAFLINCKYTKVLSSVKGPMSILITYTS